VAKKANTILGCHQVKEGDTSPLSALVPKGAVESPSPDFFKTCLDMVLCSLLYVNLLWQGGWTR